MIIESDSNKLISALNNHIEKGDWRIYPFLIEFHRIRSLLCSVSWKWISHEANGASEAAAKLAKSRLRNETWAIGPQPLVSVLSRYGLPSLIDLFRSSIWFPWSMLVCICYSLYWPCWFFMEVYLTKSNSCITTSNGY